MVGKKLCSKLCFFPCQGMSQPLDSATPARPPKVSFFDQERYVLGLAIWHGNAFV
jgi:hypothetical protein